MNMCNIKGNFFVNGETSDMNGEYSEKIRDQFKCGLDLFSLDSIGEYYVHNGVYVEPANFHPMNDEHSFLPTRSFNIKEKNLYFEDLAILAYITSFVNNTKDIDSLSFIKTKTMVDQSNAKEVYRTIPMKILIKVLEDIVGEEKITFDFKKIISYDPSKRNTVYLSTMSQNTISIQEIYRVLNYIQEIPDACEFLFYCYTLLDIHHQKFLTEISRTESGSFPYIKYNPFTDELYILKDILKEDESYMIDGAIDINAERMKQRLIRYIDSKNVFRIDVREYLEYIKKFIPNEMYKSYLFPDIMLKLDNAKRSKYTGIFPQELKVMGEFLIDVLNKSTPKYLTDKFEVGFDKFENLKIKLYKV